MVRFVPITLQTAFTKQNPPLDKLCVAIENNNATYINKQGKTEKRFKDLKKEA